jgi:hypothetical protein
MLSPSAMHPGCRGCLQKEVLRKMFTTTLNLAYDVYGDKAFRHWTGKGYESSICKGLYDSIMLTLATYWDDSKGRQASSAALQPAAAALHACSMRRGLAVS